MFVSVKVVVLVEPNPCLIVHHRQPFSCMVRDIPLFVIRGVVCSASLLATPLLVGLLSVTHLIVIRSCPLLCSILLLHNHHLLVHISEALCFYVLSGLVLGLCGFSIHHKQRKERLQEVVFSKISRFWSFETSTTSIVNVICGETHLQLRVSSTSEVPVKIPGYCECRSLAHLCRAARV